MLSVSCCEDYLGIAGAPLSVWPPRVRASRSLSLRNSLSSLSTSRSHFEQHNQNVLHPRKRSRYASFIFFARHLVPDYASEKSNAVQSVCTDFYRHPAIGLRSKHLFAASQQRERDSY